MSLDSMRWVGRRVRQVIMRICGFIMNASCQTVIMNGFVSNVEKSNRGNRNSPCKFEGRVKGINKADKSIKFFSSPSHVSRLDIYVAAERVENEFFLYMTNSKKVPSRI